MLPTIREVPPIMIIYLDHPRLKFDEMLQFDRGGIMVRLRLRGIIYGGQNHFTCRYIDQYGWVWFHDGIATRNTCVREFSIHGLPNEWSLHSCLDRTAIALVYGLA
ncbi:hypothetical protein C8R43DRAFT_900609 [Mycena crocata]|nr:hypothetical protein C8R43DRAFT_900609 [Mycena crocata]